MREAGCNLIQEVAYCFLDAIVYVEEALKRGIDIDEFAPRLSFLLGCGMNIFEEVAKFRAARRLWAKIIKNRFGAKDPNSMKMRVFSGCLATSFTASEPLNNITRGTIMTMVAVLAGCNAIHTTSYDEAYTIPTEESVRTALRTQQIIAYETDAASVIDPMGGSYLMEHLTNRIEKDVEKEMERIDEAGGMLEKIADGSIQRDIAHQAYEQEKKIETGEHVVVGVNKFTTGREQHEVKLHKLNADIRREQVENLERVKTERNNNRVKESLEEIGRIASSRGNLMGPILSAIKEYATVGEICNALRKVFGEYKEAE
jgi:methylmalonyl-CoA mutase N-terminal domain/subunit